MLPDLMDVDATSADEGPAPPPLDEIGSWFDVEDDSSIGPVPSVGTYEDPELVNSGWNILTRPEAIIGT